MLRAASPMVLAQVHEVVARQFEVGAGSWTTRAVAGHDQVDREGQQFGRAR
jgi:hypothetical protein